MELVKFENLPPKQHRLRTNLIERVLEEFELTVYDLKAKLIGNRLIAEFRDKRANKFWARIRNGEVEIYPKRKEVK